MTLVSYVPRKNRAVIFLSAMHHCNELDVVYYNATKGNVYTLDQMVHVQIGGQWHFFKILLMLLGLYH